MLRRVIAPTLGILLVNACNAKGTMETREEQLAFFGQHEAAIVTAAESGGAKAVNAFIAGFEPEEQVVLYSFHSRPLSIGDWQGKNMATIADVGDAGLDLILKLAAAETNETRKGTLDFAANVLGYNVAANLAGCWPEDDLPRQPRHYEIGLKAIDVAIDWRTRVGMPAQNLAGVWWLKGQHQLGLGDYASVLVAWQTAYDYTLKAVDEAGNDSAVSDASSPSHVVNSGYLGIGHVLNGDQSGMAAYQTAVSLLEEMKDDGTRGGEATMFLGQLTTTWQRFGN